MKIRFLKDHKEMDFMGNGAYEWCLEHGKYKQFLKGEEYDVVETHERGYTVILKNGNKGYISNIWIQHGYYELLDVESVVDHVSTLHSQVENKLNLREDIIMSVKEIKVGQMPGKIESFAVETGTTVATLLEMAGLKSDGFEIKIDGRTAQPNTQVTSSTNMVLLVKRVKGNAVKEVKVGQMPGKIESFAVETGTTVETLLELASLNADGFEIKVDGTTVDSDFEVTPSTNMVLLVKRVKGNN